MTVKTAKNVRRAIFYAFVLAYLVAATTVIAYSSGYRVHWRQMVLRQTGTIAIDILPHDTKVYVNGKRIKKSTPMRVQHLLPDTYSVRLEKDGYFTWEKMLNVRPRETTFVKGFRLIPQRTPRLIATEDARRAEGGAGSATGTPTTVAATVVPPDLFPEATNFHLVRDGRRGRVMVYSSFEIWSVDEERHTKNLITRVGEPILSVQFIPDVDSLLVVYEEKLEIVNFNDHEPYSRFEIARAVDIRDAHIDHDGREVIFVGTIDGARGVWAVEIQ